MNMLKAHAARRTDGVASVEFYLVSFFVFIPLLMAVLQMGLFFVAKNTVNLATFSAARAGAAAGGDKNEMIKYFSKAIAPLFLDTHMQMSEQKYAGVMSIAYAKARLYMAIPLINSIDIYNPTAEAFRDFGIKKSGGGLIIPTTNILHDTRVGTYSQQTRAEALLLKIEVRFCYRMVIPIIGKMVAEILGKFNPNPIDLACYQPLNGNYGLPIKSQAMIRMTEPPDSTKIL